MMPVSYRKDMQVKVDGAKASKFLKTDWKFFQRALLEDARALDAFFDGHSGELAGKVATTTTDDKSGWTKSKKRRVAQKAAKAGVTVNAMAKVGRRRGWRWWRRW